MILTHPVLGLHFKHEKVLTSYSEVLAVFNIASKDLDPTLRGLPYSLSLVYAK